MFTKKEKIKNLGRLKKRSDFLCIQSKGRKWVSKGLIVEILEKQDGGLRYGLTVSKKVSNLAVTRNRVKRRLRAAVCDVLGHYDQHNIDIVLIGRQSSQDRDYQDLCNDLRWCLKKMDIMPNKETSNG